MRGFQPAAMRGKATPFANGGPVRGPGSGTSDEVPDTVAQGTYIMPTDSTQAIGEQNLAAMGEAPRGFAPAKSAPQGSGVPVQLSNGEYKLPPEQVHAIGVQALDQMKDATHTPVAARGFSHAGLKRKAPRVFDGEPPQFFADGGVVRGLPVRRRFTDGGVADDEQKRPRSFGDAAAATVGPGVTQIASAQTARGFTPATATVPPQVPAPASAVPSPSNIFPGNRLPSASGVTSAEPTAPAPAGMTDAQRAATLAQIPADTTPATPSSFAGAGQQVAPGVYRNGNSYGDSAAVASIAQPRGLPSASVPTPTASAMSQPREMMPGVFRSGNSYADSAAGAIGGLQTRGLPSARNVAAADAMAARSQQESLVRGFQPGQQGTPTFEAPVVRHSGNDWQARQDLKNLETSASSIMNRPGWSAECLPEFLPNPPRNAPWPVQAAAPHAWHVPESAHWSTECQSARPAPAHWPRWPQPGQRQTVRPHHCPPRAPCPRLHPRQRRLLPAYQDWRPPAGRRLAARQAEPVVPPVRQRQPCHPHPP